MKITQEELAWRADMHRTYIADIECGGRNVTLRSVANLARALEVSVADLIAEASLGANGRKDARPAISDEILLVEDSVADVELTLHAFAEARLANPVRVVRDGQEALDYIFCRNAFAQRPTVLPRLVLLDLNLPRISGLDVLRQLKRHEFTAAIPVVVITMSQRHESIVECRRLGVTQHIVKPLRFENLAAIAARLDLSWTLNPVRETRPVAPGADPKAG
jgi:CheY-like chemotaxis protein/DNA-binding Xre family transcriptional regulator